MPKVILISGCKRSGKDTVANRLMERIRSTSLAHTRMCAREVASTPKEEEEESSMARVEKISFADPLREICSIAFGFTPEHYGDDLKEVVVPHLKMSPRDALIKVGTELFRKQVDPDIWVKATINKMKQSNAEYIFVTDARFHNELELVKMAFPDHQTYLIIRPEVIPKHGIFGAHETEHFAILQSHEKSYPFTEIYTNHSLDDVDKCVEDMFAKMMM
jgi:hypothetical protein